MTGQAGWTGLRDLLEQGMELAGLSRLEFARRAGLTPQFVTNLLRGRPTRRQLPTVQTMRAVARGLGVRELDVVLACSRDAGMAVDAPGATEDAAMSAIVSCARTLTAPERARLARIARAFIEGDQHQRNTPSASRPDSAANAVNDDEDREEGAGPRTAGSAGERRC